MLQKLPIKSIALALHFIVVIVCWGAVYLFGGVIGVISWWVIQGFSFIGVVTFVATTVCILVHFSRHRKIKTSLFLLLIFALLAAWPFGWFFGIWQMAYPADIQTTTPAAAIRLPINQPALVGWGGNRVETNYHAMAPNQRWAYDLLVPPAATKSTRLEDYGIYGVEVVAPASGTVVSAYDGEADMEPGTDDFESLAGNHVYLRMDDTGTYLVIAHLKQGSILVKEGQHVEEGAPIGQAGNSGSTSEPHIHIHHQRQDPSKTSMFLSEGLPLYFRDIDGPSMPEGGIHVEDGMQKPIGDIIAPLDKQEKQ